MSHEIVEFVVYIIHAIANRQHIYPSEVYNALEKTECISRYIVPCYDILHTMGTESITDDIITYMELRGVTL